MSFVCDTSPLTNLAAIGQFDLLEKCIGQIHIPEAVWQELNYGEGQPGRDEVKRASWIMRHEVSNQALVQALRRDLDQGESEAITLALELEADMVLMDEREGRRMATHLGLRCTGVLGILLEAKTQGHIKMIKPQLEALQVEAGFYLKADVYERVLLLANEGF